MRIRIAGVAGDSAARTPHATRPARASRSAPVILAACLATTVGRGLQTARARATTAGDWGRFSDRANDGQTWQLPVHELGRVYALPLQPPASPRCSLPHPLPGRVAQLGRLHLAETLDDPASTTRRRVSAAQGQGSSRGLRGPRGTIAHGDYEQLREARWQELSGATDDLDACCKTHAVGAGGAADAWRRHQASSGVAPSKAIVALIRASNAGFFFILDADLPVVGGSTCRAPTDHSEPAFLSVRLLHGEEQALVFGQGYLPLPFLRRSEVPHLGSMLRLTCLQVSCLLGETQRLLVELLLLVETAAMICHGSLEFQQLCLQAPLELVGRFLQPLLYVALHESTLQQGRCSATTLLPEDRLQPLRRQLFDLFLVARFLRSPREATGTALAEGALATP